MGVRWGLPVPGASFLVSLQGSLQILRVSCRGPLGLQVGGGKNSPILCMPTQKKSHYSHWCLLPGKCG